ncbi:MAG: hypothetical protein J6L83_02305 [Clostridia bacterium]|nr:hypothetical protein [Clostridia bacterium]
MKKILIFLLIAMLSLTLFVSCNSFEQKGGETEETSGGTIGKETVAQEDDMDELGNGQTVADDTTEGEEKTESETESESRHILLPDEETVDPSSTEEVTHENIDEEWGLGGIPLG